MFFQMKANEIKKIARSHSLYIILILLLVTAAYYDWLNLSELPALDHVTFYYPRLQVTKNSWEQFRDPFPLWTPYWNSGTPLFAKPGYPGPAYPLTWFIFFTSPNVTYKLNIFIDLIFTAISMYILMIYLFKNRKAALFSALVFIVNGWMVSRSHVGHLTTLNALPYLPLIFLFTVKASREKEWLKYSIIVGILFALQIIAGPDLKVFLFTVPLFAFYLLFYLIGKKFVKRALKAAFIGFTVLAVLAGLSAFKVLPEKEYLDLTVRAHLDFESSAKHKLKLNMYFDKLVEPVYEGFPKVRRDDGNWRSNLGIVALLLAAFYAYRNIRKKLVLFLLGSIVISLLLASGTFLFYLLWRYIPPYDSFRFLDRALLIYVFSGSILAGMGAVSFTNYLNHRFKLNKKYVFVGLVALVIINLVVLGAMPWPVSQSNVKAAIENNHILNNLSKEPGNFRIHTFETKGIDWGTEFYNVPLDLRGIFGYEGAWLRDYLNIYLSIAWNNPAKFWGILNNKYLTSQQELDMPGFKFIGKFDDCTVCFPEVDGFAKGWGPYLYENELFMPRTYLVNNSILVVGNNEQALQTMYSIMLNDKFDPGRMVIILGDKNLINDYNPVFLNKFSVIFLTPGSVDDSSLGLLRQYADSGGILVPDLVNNKNSATNEEINDILDSLQGNLEEPSLKTINFDNYLVEFDQNKKGFLVYSEKFSMFPGWKAVFDGKKENVLRANGVITAVYMDNKASVLFTYEPPALKKGLLISAITLIIITFYFINRKIRWI